MMLFLRFHVLVISFTFLVGSAYAQWVQTPGTSGKDLFALSGDGPNLFAGGLDSLYRSTNYGMTWHSVATDLPSSSVVISLLNSDETVIAGTDFWGVFRSTDNGASFDSTMLEYYTVYSLGRNSSALFTSADLFDCFDECGVFRSTDDGITWNNIFLSADPTSFSVTSSGLLLSDYEDLYRSTNNGNFWIRVSSLPAAGYIYSTRLIGNVVLVASENGLFRERLNDTTWQLVTTGLPVNAQVVSFEESSGELFAIVDGNSVYSSPDSGLTWQSFNEGFPANISVQVIVINNGFLFVTTDDGVWVRPSDESNAAKQIVVNSQWNMVSLPVTPLTAQKELLFPTSSSASFRYSAGYIQDDTLAAGRGYWLKFPEQDTILLLGATMMSDSFDVVTDWNIIGSISEPVAVSSLGSDPPGLTTSSFFGYSSGAGYTMATTIEPGKAYWVKVNQPGKLILSASGSDVSNRIVIIPTEELPPAPPDETVMANPTNAVATFLLEQNYPNPFNPSTIVNYQLPIDSWVTLKVYNMLGEEVATLVNEFQSAGHKSAVFDAGSTSWGLPSGIYTYRLTAGIFTQSRRMLLVK